MRKFISRISAAAFAGAMLGLGSTANAQPGWGMMGDWGYGYGVFGWIHMIIWLVILVAIVAGVVWLARSMAVPASHHMPPPRSSGLDVLEERYARGEINRDEYLEKKRDIAG